MNELKLFEFEGHAVRTLQKAGETWWVAKDVCEVFGETNRNRAMRNLDDDEKGYTQMTTPRGIQEVAIVNEPGLYSLLFSMKPKKARGLTAQEVTDRENRLKAFKRWVTHDVLPMIRQHGLYATEELLQNPDFLIKTLEALKESRASNLRLEEENRIQIQQIAELQPKASYYDVVLTCKDAVAISTIAKDYGKSGKWLNRYLHEAGIQFRQGSTWLLYQRYASLGYTTTRTHTFTGRAGEQHAKIHTYWTQKGRLFIYGRLKEDGILPLIEQTEDEEAMSL